MGILTGTVRRVCLGSVYSVVFQDQGMSLNGVPMRACRKTASRLGYIVKLRPGKGMSENWSFQHMSVVLR